MEATEYVSPEAKALRLTRVRKAIADPVYVVNWDKRDPAYEWLASNMPLIASGLIGPFTPAMAGVAPTLLAQSIAETAMITAAKASGIVAYAKGSKSIKPDPRIKKFASGTTATPSTEFIVGDSLNSSPNPEMVNIDWEKRSASVKPIPTDRTLKNAKSSPNPLSPHERSLPMKVSMMNNLVSYRDIKFSSNVTDDGSGNALKVYQINNNITEKIISVDGENISLADLLMNINTMLTTINEAIVSGNGINSVIAENSAKIADNTAKNNSGSTDVPFSNNLDAILKGM